MRDPDGRGARLVDSRWVRFAPTALLSCVLVAYLVRRHQVDLRFPVPWPDEGSFLWQALAFRDNFSLFAPEVNPEREAMWMPPGFMILEGLVFKVVPFSLSASRALSALFVGASVVCVRGCTRRFETNIVYPLVAGLFLFCKIALMAGNVARMEGLELLTLSLGFLLLERGRGAALGVLLLAPLVHPNGIFGLALGAPCYFFRARRGRGIFRRADWFVVGAAVLAWALYAAHVFAHWASFLRDMDVQFRFKQYVSAAEGGTLGRLEEPAVWGSALMLIVGVVSLWRAAGGVGVLGVFAAALLLQTTVAAGWLYEIYPAFAVLASSVFALEGVFTWRSASRWSPHVRAFAGALAVAAVVGFDAKTFLHDDFLERSLERATVLRESLEPAYITKNDIGIIARYLTSIAPPVGAAPLAVQFLPDAEALLYEKLRGPTLNYVQQTFYDHHYDLVILHESVWFPPFVRDLELLKVLYAKGGHYDTEVIHGRDGTEKWTVYRWSERP